MKKQSEKEAKIKFIFEIIFDFIVPFATIIVAIIGFFIYQSSEMDKDASESHKSIFKVLGWIIGILFTIGVTLLMEKLRTSRVLKKGIEELINKAKTFEQQQKLSSKIYYDTAIKNNLQIQHSHWMSWRKSLAEEDNNLLDFSLFKLMNKRISEENIYLLNKKIKTTSDVYTFLVSQLSEFINEKFANNNQKVYRYQFTGMTPEEFFNGPQIEYSTLDSTPLIFCHIWEDNDYAASFYKSEIESEIYKVRRCIFVKSNEMTIENYSTLSKVEELINQSNLSINPGEPISISQLYHPAYEGCLERLFKHCSHRIDTFRKSLSEEQDETNIMKLFLEKVITDNYKFFPISNKKEEDGAYENLLEHYASFFHSNKDDALYYEISDRNRKKIDDINAKGDYFRQGKTPEITLFGLCDKDEQNVPEEWLIGIKSHYTPFSRDIEIEILTRSDANRVASDLSFIIKNEKNKKLIDMNKD